MGVERLECLACGRSYDSTRRGPCECGRPLLLRGDFSAVRQEDLRPRADLWRYLPLLPLPDVTVRSLGEGGTPLIPCPRLAAEVGVRTVATKDEGRNPTGTFKARGMAVAVPMAKRLGATRVAIPSAGNAGSALAAYAAREGLEAVVIVPRDTPLEIVREISGFGARLFFVDGLISDAARLVREIGDLGYADLGTFREPYRVEGHKTMAFEVWEQLGGFPDWIVFPTGGGEGVVALWKGFGEIRDLGWCNDPMPRIAFVQSAGCAPLVHAFEGGTEEASAWPDAQTIAPGLRVPTTIGDALVLRATREANGVGLEVTDEAIVSATADFARLEGIHACYEGGATLAALRTLARDGRLRPEDRIVLINTGTGLKNPAGGTGRKVATVRSADELRRRLGG